MVLFQERLKNNDFLPQKYFQAANEATTSTSKSKLKGVDSVGALIVNLQILINFLISNTVEFFVIKHRIMPAVV